MLPSLSASEYGYFLSKRIVLYFKLKAVYNKKPRKCALEH